MRITHEMKTEKVTRNKNNKKMKETKEHNK